MSRSFRKSDVGTAGNAKYWKKFNNKKHRVKVKQALLSQQEFIPTNENKELFSPRDKFYCGEMSNKEYLKRK